MVDLGRLPHRVTVTVCLVIELLHAAFQGSSGAHDAVNNWVSLISSLSLKVISLGTSYCGARALGKCVCVCVCVWRGGRGSFGLKSEEDLACDLWEKILAVRQHPSNTQFSRTLTV